MALKPNQLAWRRLFALGNMTHHSHSLVNLLEHLLLRDYSTNQICINVHEEHFHIFSDTVPQNMFYYLLIIDKLDLNNLFLLCYSDIFNENIKTLN